MFENETLGSLVTTVKNIQRKSIKKTAFLIRMMKIKIIKTIFFVWNITIAV